MKEFLEEDEKKLLLDIFHIYAPTNGESSLSIFLAKFLESQKIDFTMDAYNNIYSIKYPGEPILSAHQDCVGDLSCGKLANFVDIYDFDDIQILKGNGNIGADDKIGIFLILLYLTKVNKNINFAFSTGEERSVPTGIKTIVSDIKELEAFKKAPYCIVLDRKNSGDIICKENSYGSKAFDDALSEIGKKYDYASVKGGHSDTATFSEYMNAANLSVGYYNPHTKTEFVIIQDMINTFNYLCDIIENLPRDIPYEEKSKTVYNYPSYNGYKGYNTYDDDYDVYGYYGNNSKKENKKFENKKFENKKTFYDSDFTEIYD